MKRFLFIASIQNKLKLSGYFGQSDYLYPGLGVPESRYGGGDANGNSNNLETFQKINQMLENSLDLSNLGGGDLKRRTASTGGE